MNMILIDRFHEKAMLPFPRIVCLVGSTRCVQAYQDANLCEMLNGRILLSIGGDTTTDHDLCLGSIEKTFLDILHLFTIEEVDEVQVLNVGDPIGESTCREIEDAPMLGKTLRWLEPEVHVRERDDDILVYQIRRVPASLSLSQGTCGANAGRTCVTEVVVLNLTLTRRLRQTHQTCRTAFPLIPLRILAESSPNPFSKSGDASVIDAVVKTGGSSWFTQIAFFYEVLFKMWSNTTIFKDLVSVVDLGNSQPTGKSHLAVSVSVSGNVMQSITPYALESWQLGTWKTHCSLSQTRHAGVSLFVSNAVSLVAQSAQTGGNGGRKQWRTRTGCYRTQKRRVPATEYLDQTTLRATSRQRCPGILSTLNLRVPRRTRCSLHSPFVCFSSDDLVESSCMGKLFAKKKVIPTDPPPIPRRSPTDSLRTPRRSPTSYGKTLLCKRVFSFAKERMMTRDELQRTNWKGKR